MISSKTFNPKNQDFDYQKLYKTEEEEINQSFQNSGDELLQRFLKFVTFNKDGQDYIVKDIQELNMENQNYINQIENKVKYMKNFYLEQFDLILMKISKLAESYQKIRQIQFNQNEIVDIHNLEQSWNISKDYYDKEFKDMLQNARSIENQFHIIKETSFTNDCIEIIKKTIYNISQFQFKIFNEEYQICKILCDEHQQQVNFLDLITKTTTSKRLGCQQCVDSNPQANYQPIKSIQSQWKQQENKNLEKIKINFNLLMNKNLYFQEFFNLIYNRLFKDLGQFRIKLDQMQDNCIQKIINQKFKLQKPWSIMSKEELITVSQEINSLYFYDTLCNNQDENIILLLKQTFRSLNNYIQVYANKMTLILENPTSVKQEFRQQQNYQDMKLFGNQEQTSQKKTQINQNTLEIKQNIFGNNFEIYGDQRNLEKEMSQNQQKQFTYKLIQESSIKQKEACYALAFDQQLNILAVACNKSIKIYEFKDFKLNFLQELVEHANLIFCLSFMKKSKSLISCGNNQIIIWLINENNFFICRQKLEGHLNVVRCVLCNNAEDLIISGSDDMKIKVWHKSQEWYCGQTISEHSKIVLALSLNEQEDRLISCSDDKSLLLLEISEQDRKWFVKQKIVLESYGLRLCFINNALFTFQPINKEQMHVYEIENDKIVKKSELNLIFGNENQSLFPQQYIKAKSLLVSKNGYYVHIVRLQDNNKFTLQQSINFGNQILYGIASEDGEFLITWDFISCQIQVRQYVEI